jgi:hypothetical protein
MHVVFGAPIERGAWQLCARAGWNNGDDSIAPPCSKRLACEPLTEAARSVDCPLGDFCGDAKPFAELTVDKEAERRDECSSEGGGNAVVDMDVGREPRIDDVLSRLEIQNREGASADPAEDRAAVLTPGEENEPSRLAPEHLSNAVGSIAIAGPIPVSIEYPNLIAPELSEARRGGGHLWCVQEGDVDIEWHMDGVSVHDSDERGLEPDAIHGR